MGNFNDSQRQSYDVGGQNIELISGTLGGADGTISDVETVSYADTTPMAKNRIII